MTEGTQIGAVLAHLKEHGELTSMEAFKLYGCTRLAARIFDLRKQGFVIDTIEDTGKTRYGTACKYARYVLSRKQRKNG